MGLDPMQALPYSLMRLALPVNCYSGREKFAREWGWSLDEFAGCRVYRLVEEAEEVWAQ